MTATASPPTDEFLTLSDAARIAGRSYSWARTRALLDGRLDVRRFTPGGITYVTSKSLSRLLDTERKQDAKPARRHGRRPRLRLVIDNT